MSFFLLRKAIDMFSRTTCSYGKRNAGDVTEASSHQVFFFPRPVAELRRHANRCRRKKTNLSRPKENSPCTAPITPRPTFLAKHIIYSHPLILFSAYLCPPLHSPTPFSSLFSLQLSLLASCVSSTHGRRAHTYTAGQQLGINQALM